MTSQPRQGLAVEHSDIYTVLVKNQDDLVGALAYCFYKEVKRDFILGIIEATGRPPTPQQMADFHFLTTQPKTLNSYRERGEKLVGVYNDLLLREAGRRAIKGVEESAAGRLVKRVLDEIVRPRTPMGWLSECAKGLMANLMTIAIIGILYVGYKGMCWITALWEKFWQVHP